MGKKNRKRAESEPQVAAADGDHLNGDSFSLEEKKEKKKKRKKEKETYEKGIEKEAEANESSTTSIAIPGSIIDNAQSLKLATRLAGQIARAATIFRIDEVNEDPTGTTGNKSDENESGAAFLIRILRYLETPQYLSLLPLLDAPHHLRKHEWASFREGVTLKGRAPNSEGTLVDVGLSKNVIIDQVLEPGRRVTVAMGTNHNLDAGFPRQVVSSSKPKEEAGMYWGYRVRYASNISSVFGDCPYKGGYDHLIGTSEHGQQINSLKLSLPTFRHLLIAFGGLAGLEESIEEDSKLKGKSVEEVSHSYLNTCPHQGSRTIQTEEAIFISLQYFREPIERALGRFQPES